MKKFFKITGIAVFLVVVLLAGFVLWVQARGIPTYAVPPPGYTATPVVATPARLALGEKLVLSDCADCHLNRQTGRLSGKHLTEVAPALGKLYSSNITQDSTHGIGTWTNADITTLLRTGIGHDGRYRILMPRFVHMSDDDVAGIVAFLRSDNTLVEPDATPSRPQELTLLAKVLVNTVMKPLPQPTAALYAPTPTDALAYGRYLVVGRYLCYDCHSQNFETNNALEPEKSAGYLAGGNPFLDPQGQTIRSPNLTADPETGLGTWQVDQFTRAVKYGLAPSRVLREPMPKFSLLSDEEAAAIFAYLQSVPKIRNATPKKPGTVAAR